MTVIPANYLKVINYLESNDYGNECKSFGFCKRSGYESVTYKQKQYDTHRLALAHKLGREVIQANHYCHNPACCNPNHLYEGTQKQNMTDKVVAGRGNTTKLTAEQVEQIRYKRNVLNVKLKYLSAEYGVSMTQISDIARGLKWTTHPVVPSESLVLFQAEHH